MKPKKILMQLLIIGVVGSVFVLSFIGCNKSKEPCIDFYFDYYNNTHCRMEIKVYRYQIESIINMEENTILSQKLGRGMTNEDVVTLIFHSDSICVVFPELGKSLWFHQHGETSFNEKETSPYCGKNYTLKKESKNRERLSYYFTQEHIDLAQPINQQPE